MSAARILVVEDDEILRETLSEVMSDEGHEVRSAADGQAALDTMTHWEPDVILLDVMMPRMDAHEFRRRQRAGALAGQARVIVVSAARDVASAAERLEADAWLAKPFRLLEVIEAVDQLVRDGAN
ncbi:MAG: response regulator [Chloroflexi bacterium]|nr:response regulator [Chloroflexota bacterium]